MTMFEDGDTYNEWVGVGWGGGGVFLVHFMAVIL